MNSMEVTLQMQAAGLAEPPAPLRLDGKVVRFGPKKRQWYSLREIRTESGQFVVVGSFGDWAGQTHRVAVDWKGITEQERQQLRLQQAAQAERQAAERAELAALAHMRAAELWSVASKTGKSDYLVRKGVEAEGCRFLRDGSIVIPLISYALPREQALRGLQRIFADGTKMFTKGFDKVGSCLRLGMPAAHEPILVCEGYATGLTLRMACAKRLAVFVALDCGNLAAVVPVLRKLYPSNPILVCADDDWKTVGNPGRAAAHKVAKAVDKCRYTWPYFRSRGPKDTDFNDLQRIEGLNVVRRQLSHVVPQLQPIAYAA
jgi:putative DNA primase/helicase